MRQASYPLDNLLVDEDARATAVLGDPLSDLGRMVVYNRLGEIAGDDVGVSTVAGAPGHLTETETIERYAAGSGRDLSRFGFHLGLAAFQLAVIVEGVHYRHPNGQTDGEGGGPRPAGAVCGTSSSRRRRARA
ncbi:hypothetical protein [Streptomyces sp. R44]|uniref:Uncharacterized protein n=1 Tax=Streptomyces sp. R44 TaxID=3238633 RepID=A0AB39TB92_9ACTN